MIGSRAQIPTVYVFVFRSIAYCTSNHTEYLSRFRSVRSVRSVRSLGSPPSGVACRIVVIGIHSNLGMQNRRPHGVETCVSIDYFISFYFIMFYLRGGKVTKVGRGK